MSEIDKIILNGTEYEIAGSSGGGGTGVPATVRKAISNVLSNNAFSTLHDFNADLSVIEEWASTTCTAITLSAFTLTFYSETPQRLTATLTPSDCSDTIYWTTTDADVATVSNGIVTPIGNGTCSIVASVGDISATCNVVVSGIRTRFTVTNNLIDCTSTNNSTTVRDGDTYSATIKTIANTTPTILTVSMNDVDITSTAVSGTNIAIANVTGNIVITASALPTGYTRFDYIKNTVTGNSGITINTEIEPTYASPDYDHEIVLKFNGTFATSASALAGIRRASGQSVSSRVLWQKSGSFSVDYNGIGTGYVIPVEQNVKYSVKTANEKLYINDVVNREIVGSYTDFTLSKGLTLFGCAQDTQYVSTGDKILIYSYTITNASTGNYIACLVPCKNDNNVPGVYDVIRETFYTSSDPSKLSCGNDV